MKLELWMTIPGYKDYKISSHGRVYSLKSNKELKYNKNAQGYHYFRLYKNKQAKTFKTHRLVASTFLEEDIREKQVDHIDGNKQNNFFQNLRICSHQQNLFNRGKYKNNTSGLKGIIWDKQQERWKAQIKINGKVRNLGRFSDKEKAYEKYKEAAKYYHGDYLYQHL